MTSKWKIEEACNTLKPLGISKAKVRANLKELLKIYDNNWELIEDEGYSVLIDTILEKEDKAQVVQMKKKASLCLSCEASETSPKNLCTRNGKRKSPYVQRVDSSSANVLSEDEEADVIEQTSYSQTHSELEVYKPPSTRLQLRQKKEASASAPCSKKPKTEVSASVPNSKILKREASTSFPNSNKQEARTSLRRAHKIRTESSSDSEDLEPPLKTLYRKCQNSIFMDTSKSSLRKGLLNEAGFSQSLIEEVAESIQLHVESEQTNLIPALPLQHAVYERKKCNLFKKCPMLDITKPSQLCIEYNNEKSPLLPLAAPKEREENCMECYENQKVMGCLDLVPSENVLDLYQPEDEVPVSVIHPGHPFLLQEDASSNENNSNAEVDGLTSMGEKCVDVDKKQDSLSTSQFDLASSPNGEVKLRLVCNTLQQSDFCVPSFDEVVKVVEDKYRKSYGIEGPEFCLKKLMTDLCECFLAKGSAVVPGNDEHIVPSVQMISPKECDSTKFVSSKGACQLDFLIPPAFLKGSFKFQNLIEVMPQVSKHITLTGLDFLRCMIGFKIKDIESICAGTGKILKALEGTNLTSFSSEVCKKHQLLHDVVKSYAYLDDISRGEERIKISFIKGNAPEDLPAFAYIAQNVVYDKASVKFALASISDKDCCKQCTGDCLTSAMPCACAQETGGEFAYTDMGLIKERFLDECISLYQNSKKECDFYCMSCPLQKLTNFMSSFCQGHCLRKFIKECWSRCGCSKKCGNRIVQRGITRNLQVFWTPEGKGWGLRTVESLPRGAFVCEYIGEILTYSELCERNQQTTKNQNMHPAVLDAGWGSGNVLKDDEILCLDASNYGNIARFINHRCSGANLVEIPVEVETSSRHYYHLALFTKREVAAMEELTLGLWH